MLFEVTADEIKLLNDADLRQLAARLCEHEVSLQGFSPVAVTLGGHQNAPDGGIDVRVSLLEGSMVSGYVPSAASGFQVKAQDMPHQAILDEMAPNGVLRDSIAGLAAARGAYIIVSSQGSVADSSSRRRCAFYWRVHHACASRESIESPHVIYGGARWAKSYGAGFKLRFIDRLQGRAVLLYVPPRVALSLASAHGALMTLRRGSYATVYALGNLEQGRDERSLSINITSPLRLVLQMPRAVHAAQLSHVQRTSDIDGWENSARRDRKMGGTN